MGRRHRSKTGDGGGEIRLAKRRGKEVNHHAAVKDLKFHDDPSSSDDANQAMEESEDEFEDDEEELLPLDNDQWSDEEDDEEDKQKQLEEIEAMGDQWGKSKKTFYSADTAEFEMQSDEEIAMEEEEAALELQQQELEELDEEDFEFDEESDSAIEDEEADVTKKLEGVLNTESSSIEEIQKDLSSLSRSDKLEILARSSPELIGMINELNEKLGELQEEIEPIIQRLDVEDERVDVNGISFMKFKRQLWLLYCSNITFYLSLKAKKQTQSVKDHPVIQHILSLKAMIDAVKTKVCSAEFNKQVQLVLSKDAEHFKCSETADGMEEFFFDENASSNSDSDVSEDEQEKTTVSTAVSRKKKRKSSQITEDEKRDAEEYYNAIQASHGESKNAKEEFYSHMEPVELDDQIDSDAKRGATYQIIKNRGLTAHKKKLNRNPRVKKRVQYRKAVIRRKGQVRDVRTGEAGYYGGELTGIKSNITRSRKLRN